MRFSAAILMQFPSRPRFGPAGSRGASVLLEVVLALALFAAAAAIIGGALSTSMDTLERLRLNTHAANLAVSVLSELEMGSRTPPLNGPEPFETPFEFWNWDVVVTALEDELGAASGLQQVEVIITHQAPPIEYHLIQMTRLGQADSSGDMFDPATGGFSF